MTVYRVEIIQMTVMCNGTNIDVRTGVASFRRLQALQCTSKQNVQGQMSCLDRCHVWTDVLTGQMSSQDKCPVETNVVLGQMEFRTNVALGQMLCQDKCRVKTNVVRTSVVRTNVSVPSFSYDGMLQAFSQSGLMK